MADLQAVISDIHSNLEALEAVLSDIQQQGATSIICLGDLVGYGPDPSACVRHAMKWDVVLMGNHDQAVVSGDDLSGWSTLAARHSILELKKLLAEMNDGLSITSFLRTRPEHYAHPQALYVHGSPRDPIHEYVFPEDIYNQRKMELIAQAFEGLCFCGHTHVAGIFTPNEDGNWDFLEPDLDEPVHPTNHAKMICNVGSVGMPRDGDSRASYVLFDGETIRYRRVDFTSP